MFLGSPLVSGEGEEEVAIYTTMVDYVVQNVGGNMALDSKALIVLFDNFSGWADQEILSEQIAVDGVVISPQIFSTEDNRWTTISLGNLSPEESKTISVVQTLKIGSINLSIDPDSVGTIIPPELSAYTQPVEGLYESDNPTIKALAQQLTENTTNLYYKARQLFDFVMENLGYELQPQEHSALWGFQAGKGDCTEFSNLFIALARAAGIPAKSVSGFGYLALYNPEATTDLGQLGHAWSLFYLPNYGWVPADAVWPQGTGSFGEMDYAHIVGATTGGEGVVDAQGQITWRAPRYVARSWSYYTGQPTELGGTVSGLIIPEILVDVNPRVSSTIQDDVMSLTVTIKNMGRNLASNLKAGLDVDPAYFEVITTSQQKDNLVNGEQWVTGFNVRLKENAYGRKSVLTAKVTYDSSYGTTSGTFLAKGKIAVSIGAKPPLPRRMFDLILYALIGALVGAIVMLGVAIARR